MIRVEVLAVALYLAAALVWTIISAQLWVYRWRARPRSQALRVVPIATSLVALHYIVHMPWPLLPAEMLARQMSVVQLAVELTLLAGLAVWRHLLRLMPLPEDPPGRWWLGVNYGLAVVGGSLFAWTRLWPRSEGEPLWMDELFIHGSLFVLAALFLWQAMRVARPGVWGPEHAGEIRRWDLVIVGRGMGLVGLAVLGLMAADQWLLVHVVLEVGTGLAFAGPAVISMLGVVLPEFLVTLLLLVSIGGLLEAQSLAFASADASLHPLVELATVLATGLVVTVGQMWLRARVHRLVFRRSLHQHAELLSFLHTLSPELGLVECCRRALVELVRVRQLPGAAILLRDGEAVVTGTFDVASLLRVWPRGAAADALPVRPFGSAELRELPLALREALIEANVGLGAAPIVSPRRRWGHLFMGTGLLRGTFRDDDMRAFEAFVAQLALLLDAADLLARAVAVERSLAHAEKLAAIGETAARVAHEIRNPITAARSLAQQLAREPIAPFRDELNVILTELERVERQVAALLRFARRDDLCLEAIDLGGLVRQTVDDYRERLASGGVVVAVDAAGAVRARGDREKLRQVLINLFDNALDVLAGVAGERRLAVAVAQRNGSACLDVTDGGPGVSAEMLARLFEPFFSTKPAGTGLGLAIVRRTIEAHHGRISVTSPPGQGLTVAITLPAVEEEGA